MSGETLPIKRMHVVNKMQGKNTTGRGKWKSMKKDNTLEILEIVVYVLYIDTYIWFYM